MSADQYDGENATPILDGDRTVPLLEGFAMLGAASATTGYRSLKTEPGFPRPVEIGRRRLFLQSELIALLERLAAQRVGEPVTAVDGSSIKTIEHCATILAGFMTMGRIAPIRPEGEEAARLLDDLTLLVKRQDPQPGEASDESHAVAQVQP